MSSNNGAIGLTPRCHCRTWSPINIPASAFPLHASACHCRACRQATGSIATYLVRLPTGVSFKFSAEDEKALRRYQSSGHMIRCFCGICGAKIKEEFVGSDIETVYMGILPASSPSGEPTYKLQKHIFVQPADGGGVLRYCNDGVPRFEQWNENLHVDPSKWTSPVGHSSQDLELLPLRCHCGEFTASLKRPSAFADQSAPIFKDCKDNKWPWSIDFCTSCRTTSGAPFGSFISASPSALVIKGNAEALTRYESSSNVWRSFCPTCGASVLYEDRQPGSRETVALWFGVVDLPLRAALESWLVREDGLPEFLEDAAHSDIANALADGWMSSDFP